MSNQNTSVYSYYDLDLDELESIEDPDKLPGIVQNLLSADSAYKIGPARQWIENFLYYGGTRDIITRLASGTVTGRTVNSPFFGNIGPTGNRRRIPKLFKAVQATAANLTRNRPSIKVWPDGDDETAETKAKMSNLLLDYYWDLDHEDDINMELMLWALLSPAAARKDYISHEFDESRMFPKMSQVIDPNTGNYVAIPEKGPSGGNVMQQMPWNKTDVVSAFRLFFNPSANWIDKVDFVGDVSVMRIGEFRQEYIRNGEGYLPWNAEKVTKGSWGLTAIMSLESTLKSLTFGAYRAPVAYGFNGMSVKDGVVKVNLFVKPSPKYPYGREIVVGNGFTVYDGPSTVYRRTPKRVWHPYSFLCYERFPGRLWGTSYAEKLTDQQRAYEQARSEMDVLRRTLTSPKMAIPIGAQIDRDTMAGGVEVYRYNAFGPDGGKPAFMTPPPPSTVLVDDTRLQQGDWMETSGITELTLGINPKGVTTYRGLETLKEEANNLHNSPIRMYESCIQDSQWNKLENIRKCLTYQNKDLSTALRVFKKMKNYVTDIDVKDFCGSDLAGYVTIEPMSSIGKSRIALQEKYMTLAQMGVLGDVANDPDLNNEFKRKMDVSGFDRPQNRQVTMARYENNMMLQSESMKIPVVPPINEFDDDAIHIREVEAIQLDPANKDKTLTLQAAAAHKNMHIQRQAMLMARQAQLASAQAQVAHPANVNEEKKPGGVNSINNGSGGVTSSNMGGGGPQDLLFAPESGGANNIKE